MPSSAEHSMADNIIKRSAIMIATGDKVKVYERLEDVPPELRKKLDESTSSLNSGTILIADRGGREKIRGALECLVASADAAAEEVPAPRRSRIRTARWLLAGTIGASLGFLCYLLLKRLA